MEWKSINVTPYDKPVINTEENAISECQVSSTLICAQGENVGVCSFSYEKEEGEWIPKFRFTGFFVIGDSEIDHWMSFPDSPNKTMTFSKLTTSDGRPLRNN